jgi:hypothetical protein
MDNSSQPFALLLGVVQAARESASHESKRRRVSAGVFLFLLAVERDFARLGAAAKVAQR